MSFLKTRFRGALLVLAALAFWPATSQAGSVSATSTLTLPSTITASTVLGPQTLQINTSNSYTAQNKIGVQLNILGASFVTNTVPTISGLTGCNTTALVNTIIFDQCTPTGSAIQVSSVSYNNATGLNSGTPIRINGQIYNANNTAQTFETLEVGTVVEAPVQPSTFGINAASISTSRSHTLNVTVTRSGGTSTAATLSYATSDGTAVSGSDYTATAGTLNFEAGATTATIPVVILNNTARTTSATFNILLSNASGGGTITTPSTTITIQAQPLSTVQILTQTSGSGSGTISPSNPTATSGSVITLTATPGSGSVFAGWTGGGCSGTATTCQVTAASGLTVTAVFNTAAASTYSLNTATSGTGTGQVSANPSAASYAPGTVVTLTATASSGSTFTGWSGGGCSTASTCQVTMNENKTVTATFTLANSSSGGGGTLRQGAVFSSASATSASFLRFYNAGSSAGTVTVTLSDYITGQKLGQWTSSSIAPGTAPQIGISTVEAGLPSGTTRPSFYSVTMVSQFAGTFQHVLYKPGDGTLTNLSTCDSGITAVPGRVANVHSSILGNVGFPSSVVVYNTGTTAAAVSLAITDAGTGNRLGVYSSSTIPANGQQILAVSAIESAISLTPTSSILHYVVTVQGSFTGYLQHLVNNMQSGVTTDMSTVCTFPTVSTGTTTPPVGNPSGN